MPTTARKMRRHEHEGGVLAVLNPAEVEVDANKFRIGSAKALRWTWYNYGRRQNPENLFYMDYAQENGSVRFRTNWDQIPGTGSLNSAAAFPPLRCSDSSRHLLNMRLFIGP